MILLLYANIDEVKYIDYEPRIMLGLRATDFPPDNFMSGYSGVVLFGSCGLLKEYYDEYGCYYCDEPDHCNECDYKVKYDRFIVPEKWVGDAGDIIKTDDLFKLPRMGTGLTWTGSVRSKHLTEYVKVTYPDAMCVDQESFIVGKYCKERKIPFVSVRYVIDRCNRKVMLPAFNYFWRRNQHKRMQRKFNELIKSL
jgi:hypothetical protein